MLALELTVWGSYSRPSNQFRHEGQDSSHVAMCPHALAACCVNALTHTQPPVSYLILYVSTMVYNYNTYDLLLLPSMGVFPGLVRRYI